MKLYTIGFSGKSAQIFFEKLIAHDVKTLIDIRLNNKSQMVGFTKLRDFPYLLQNIANINFLHVECLAPTKELLVAYQEKKINRNEYAVAFRELLDDRKVIELIQLNTFDNGCLMCSEPCADDCHRGIVAEYFKKYNKLLDVIHL